jgi:hypothetical protein
MTTDDQLKGFGALSGSKRVIADTSTGELE